jgi:tripartite-type tricarboxylate transporter receptor subunit TctC
LHLAFESGDNAFTGADAMSVSFRLNFCVAIFALTVASVAQAQQNWPTRPISMVVPFGAGSSSDTAARIIGARMSELLGQQIVVENTPGAGGMTGSARVTSAPPDGYMASFASTDTIAINQTMYKRPLYNSATDFTPVILTLEQPMVLIVRKDLPVSTLAEFIAYAKEHQATMQYGSSGVGSSSHLGCTRLNAAIGISPVHVPYRGSGQAMQDLAGGRIDYFCALGAAAMVPLENKSAKPIAVLAKERTPLFPSIPSTAEQGLTGVETYFWAGIFYPAHTPDAIVQKLNEVTSQALDTPATAQRLTQSGASVMPKERRSVAYAKKFVNDEIADWAKTIKASNISLD